MAIKVDQVQMRLTIEGRQALNELSKLEVEQDQLKASTKELIKAMKDAEKQFGKESDQAKAATKALDEHNATIKETATKIENLRKSQGDQLRTSASLQREMSEQVRLLKQLTFGTDEYVKASQRASAIQKELDFRKANAGDGGGGSLLSQIKDQLPAALAGGVAGGIVGIAVTGFAALGQAISSVIPPMKELADENSDLIIALGLSNDEVEQLNGKFRKINTRTAVKELKEIGTIAGDLNATNAELEGFVRSGDKLATVFKKDFGSTEETIELFGRLKEEFKDLKDLKFDATFEKLGSTVKVLNDAGPATSKGIAEFLGRVGQLPNSLKPAITELAAYAAAFEEANLTAEISSGGLSNILLVAAKNTEPFAKFLGLTNKEFKELINTDPNKFLLTLAERFKGLSATQVAKTLSAMKIESQESIKVLGVLSDNLETVKQKQTLAAQAFAEGTRLTEVFNEKNNNFAGSVEKISKAIGGFLANNSVTKELKSWFISIVELMTKTGKTVEDVALQYDNQASKVDNLRKNIVPLIDRYEVLSTKQNRTHSEQTELNNAIASISTVIPSAIGQVDRYGNALSINAGKAREFVEAQQRYLQTINAELIGGKRNQSFDAAKEIGKNTAEINRILTLPQNKAGDFVDTKVTVPQNNSGLVISEDVIIPASTVEKLRKRNADIKEEMLKLGRDIQFLRGELDPNAGKPEEKKTNFPTIPNLGGGDNDKLKKELEEKARLIAEYELRRRLLAESEANREVLRAEQETEKVLDELKKRKLSTEDYEKIKAVLVEELGEKVLAIRKKQYEKEVEEEKKRNERVFRITNEAATLKVQSELKTAEDAYETDKRLFDEALKRKAKAKEIADRQAQLKYDLSNIFNAKITELGLQEDLELFLDNNKNKENIEKKYLQKRIDLQREFAQKLAGVDKEITDEDLRKAKESLELRKKLQEQYAQIAGQAIGAFFDVFKANLQNEESAASNSYNRRLKALEEQQKAGMLSEDAYQAAKARIEQNYSEETRKIKRKQAEADKINAIFQATIAGAVAIIQNLKNPALAIAAGITAGIQIAKIVATPIPEFAEGGMTPGQGTLAMVGEKGKEYIIPNWMLQRPDVGGMVSSLETIRTQGSINNTYVTNSTGSSANNYSQNSTTDPMVLAVMTRLLQRLDEPIKGVWDYQTYKKGKDMYEEIYAAAKAAA